MDVMSERWMRDMSMCGRLAVISGGRGSMGCSCLAEPCLRLGCGALKLEGTGYWSCYYCL